MQATTAPAPAPDEIPSLGRGAVDRRRRAVQVPPAALIVTAAVIALAPLPLASNRPWAWSLACVLVGAALVLWGIGALLRPDSVGLSWRRHGFVTAVFLLLCLWLAFQSLGLAPAGWHDPLWHMAGDALGMSPAGAISTDPLASRGGLLRLICYAGTFWIAAQCGREAGNARLVLWVVAAAATLYSAYGIAVFTSGNATILWFVKWAYPHDLTATFVNRNNFADYVGLGLMAGTALLIRSARRAAGNGLRRFIERLPTQSYILILACATQATALALSHSRGGMITTLLGMVVLLGALAAGSGRRAQGRTAIAAALLMAVFALFEASGEGTARRLMMLPDEGTGRERIHSLAFRAMADSPLTGRGLDTFSATYYRYRDGTIPWSSPPYGKAHGTWLEFALEAGLAGAGLMALLIAAIGFTLMRGVLRRRRDVEFPCIGLACGALIGIHSLFDFGVQIPAVAITYSALAGVAFAQSFGSRPHRLRSDR